MDEKTGERYEDKEKRRRRRRRRRKRKKKKKKKKKEDEEANYTNVACVGNFRKVGQTNNQTD